MTGISAKEWRQRAEAAEQSGNVAHALTILEQGVAALPQDAALANSAGNIAMRAKNFSAAARLFQTAVQHAPDVLEFSLNCAIALSRMERFSDALATLLPFADEGSKVTRYCSVRAMAERGSGNLAEAASWFDRCIILDPKHPRALHGRALLALQRGERDTLSRYDQALEVTSNDAELWLGRAQALDVAGDTNGAREIAELLVQQAPQWLDGLQFLAQLRLAAGEPDFTAHYDIAMRRVPQDFNIAMARCMVLAGLDLNKDAAAIARKARAQFPQIEQFALLEAVYSSAAGDDDHAEAVWNTISVKNSEERLHLARHRLRQGDIDRAGLLLDRTLAEHPGSVSAWALMSVVWRLTEDPREEWLHMQHGLIRLVPLQDGEHILPPAIEQLHRLHDVSAQPLGQSLRGGTQTRALLFDRTEPEFSALRGAILATIENYRASLPRRDVSHPVLRHLDVPWNIAGSWSVRFAGGGDQHASHIHPLGMLSSALYCESPPEGDADPNSDPQAGWLELGRPPVNLKVDLEPIAAFPPRAGHLALFPSTLYHGTRPFTHGRRLTVAFDVTPTKEPL